MCDNLSGHFSMSYQFLLGHVCIIHSLAKISTTLKIATAHIAAYRIYFVRVWIATTCFASLSVRDVSLTLNMTKEKGSMTKWKQYKVLKPCKKQTRFLRLHYCIKAKNRFQQLHYGFVCVMRHGQKRQNQIFKVALWL